MPLTAQVKLAFTCKISPGKCWWLLSPPSRVMGLLGHLTASKSPHQQHLNKTTSTSNWTTRTSTFVYFNHTYLILAPSPHQISLMSHKTALFFSFATRELFNFPENFWVALELWHVSTKLSLRHFFLSTVIPEGSGPQPFWHRGPVSWKTIFPRAGGRAEGGCRRFRR